MLPVVLATLAFAAPLEAPIPDRAHGTYRVGLGFTGNGTKVSELVKLPTRSLRLELVPTQHFGAWLEGSWLNEAASPDTRYQGWGLALGARGGWWLGRSIVGIGAAGRFGEGDSWTRLPTHGKDLWARHILVEAMPAVELGPENGGAYAWVGPVFLFNGQNKIAPDGAMQPFELADPPLHAAIEVGGELHSDDLLGYGDRRTAYLSFGSSVRRGSTWSLAVWTGVAF
jgi:hypothetical protein